jgi:hypothetical protein
MLRMLYARVGVEEREQEGEDKTPSYNLSAHAFNNYNNWPIHTGTQRSPEMPLEAPRKALPMPPVNHCADNTLRGA